MLRLNYKKNIVVNEAQPKDDENKVVENKIDNGKSMFKNAILNFKLKKKVKESNKI